MEFLKSISLGTGLSLFSFSLPISVYIGFLKPHNVELEMTKIKSKSELSIQKVKGMADICKESLLNKILINDKLMSSYLICTCSLSTLDSRTQSGQKYSCDQILTEIYRPFKQKRLKNGREDH